MCSSGKPSFSRADVMRYFGWKINQSGTIPAGSAVKRI
jgi:hypothetical protein